MRHDCSGGTSDPSLPQSDLMKNNSRLIKNSSNNEQIVTVSTAKMFCLISAKQLNPHMQLAKLSSTLTGLNPQTLIVCVLGLFELNIGDWSLEASFQIFTMDKAGHPN